MMISSSETLNKQNFQEAAECLKALAHPIRLEILNLIRYESLTVGELAIKCEIKSNHASEHLRLLKRCGFIKPSREGKKVYYKISEPHLLEILSCIESKFAHQK